MKKPKAEVPSVEGGSSNQDEEVSDLEVVGNGDLFVLLSQASSPKHGWMHRNQAMQVPGGCVVKVTTVLNQHVSIALVFVPCVKIVDDENGGRKLVAL